MVNSEEPKPQAFPCPARYEYPDGRVFEHPWVYEINVQEATKAGIRVTLNPGKPEEQIFNPEKEVLGMV